MQIKKFHREEYPLDILEEFGLTPEMIYDLPDFVHEVIEMGGKSPLLPVRVEESIGFNQSYAKFSLIETEYGMDVLFYPKLRQASLDEFSAEQQDILRAGRVIVADITERHTDLEGKEKKQKLKAFVQLDRDTNDIVYTPTQIIGRNLKAICNEFDLPNDSLLRFWDGNLVSTTETDDEGREIMVTIGIDLSVDTGVIVIPGTSDQWEKSVRRDMPPYSFGNDGCWVNRGGRLAYVPEEEFTPDILEELYKAARRYGVTPQGGYDDEARQAYSGPIQQEMDENRQMTR